MYKYESNTKRRVFLIKIRKKERKKEKDKKRKTRMTDLKQYFD